MVLKTNFLYLDESRRCVVSGCCKDILGNLVEDIVLKPADHAKQVKLFSVEKGLERQGTSNAEYK